MKAYQNKITKAEFVAEMKRHHDADTFLRGTYSDNEQGRFRGCAVGCGVESLNRTKGLNLKYLDHEGLAEALGIPAWVTHFQDLVFENISFERHKSWPVEFAETIQEGTDLNQIEVPLKIFILEDVLKVFDGKDDDWGCKRAVEKVIETLRCGDKHKIAEAARAAARAAGAAWAAEAAEAAEAAARAAARAAAEAAWAAARAAAWAAARAAAAEAAAWAAAWDRYADKFLELVRGLK